MDSAEEAAESGPWAYDDRVHALEDRLAAADPHVAVVVSARAALRAIPALSFMLTKRSPQRFKEDRSVELVLSAFRAVQCSWTASAFPQFSGSPPAADTAEATEGAARSIGTETDGRFALYGPAYAAYAASGNNPNYTAAVAISLAPVSNHFAALVTGFPRGRPERAEQIKARTARAAEADLDILDRGFSPHVLARQPLWNQGELAWTRNAWSWLKDELLSKDRRWQVWVNWYEARLRGRQPNEALELAWANIAPEVWRLHPQLVNSELERLIEMYSAESFALPDHNRLPPLPKDPILPISVPAQKPAAVETVWDKGKLSVPKKPAKSNLTKKKLEAAFAALRAELRELASDMNAEGNIDKRPADFLQRLAGRIPEAAPRQDELFRLGHAEAIFAGYAATVAQEWPDFLAARYHAVSLQFDRTMRQSPLWREFVANAAKQTMSAEQIADSTLLAAEAAKALRRDEAPAFVDPVVPQALEQLADVLPVTPAGAPDAIESGKELLAADLVESVNNTLKPIAEVALSSAGDYAEGFGKGFKKAAKKQGSIDGEKAFKWLRRLAIGGAAGTGSFVALSNLITKFPEAFGWLERILHLIK
jgi:hypothetical protein